MYRMCLRQGAGRQPYGLYASSVKAALSCLSSKNRNTIIPHQLLVCTKGYHYVPSRSFTLEQILTTLAETPPRIAEFTVGLTEAQLHAAPGSGEWSANEVLAHLRAPMFGVAALRRSSTRTRR